MKTNQFFVAALLSVSATFSILPSISFASAKVVNNQVRIITTAGGELKFRHGTGYIPKSYLEHERRFKIDVPGDHTYTCTQPGHYLYAGDVKDFKIHNKETIKTICSSEGFLALHASHNGRLMCYFKWRSKGLRHKVRHISCNGMPTKEVTVAQ